MKLVPIPGKQSSFKILQFFIHGVIKGKQYYYFSSVVTLTYKESDGVFSCMAIRYLKLTRLSATIIPYLAQYIKHNNI